MRDSFASVPSSSPRPLAGSPAQAQADSLPTAPTPATPTRSLDPDPSFPFETLARPRVGQLTPATGQQLPPNSSPQARPGPEHSTPPVQATAPDPVRQFEPVQPTEATKNLQTPTIPPPATVARASSAPVSARTRGGKIARLPRALRDQLNLRLLDNEPAPSLVAWLNSLPEVQSLLAALFAGRPINDQNIYDWKAGGFADWVAHQNSLAQVRSLCEHLQDFDPATSAALDDQAASFLLANLLRCLAPGGCPEPRVIHALVTDIQALRRSSALAFRARLDQERLQLDRLRLELDAQRLSLQQPRIGLHSHRSDQDHLRLALAASAAPAGPDSLPAPPPALRLPQAVSPAPDLPPAPQPP